MPSVMLAATINYLDRQTLSVVQSEIDFIKTATDYFNNDSFWLVAPFKVYDNGVKRSIVKYNNNLFFIKPPCP